MFKINHLTKKYDDTYALQDVSCQMSEGIHFIVGESGSGKTTLLNILSGLDTTYEGNVFFYGKEMKDLSHQEKSAMYNHSFGFIFQDFNLLENASVIENVMLPTYLKEGEMTSHATRILKQLKIEHLKDQKVKELSGGQKQRVAIARELMKNPQVIFCDEPTSALDSKNAKALMTILRDLAKKKCIIIVTHDETLYDKTDDLYYLEDGKLTTQNGNTDIKEKTSLKIEKTSFSIKKMFQLAFINLKNKLANVMISSFTLLLAGTLLLTTLQGALQDSGQKQFQELLNTYGPGILDISLYGSFMSASGGEGNSQSGSVNQDLGGLFEKYENDDRVEFIILSQAFENIQIELDGKQYQINKTGNTPVLTDLIEGEIPATNEYQVVVPVSFVEQTGFTNQEIIGKNMKFEATIFQWVNNQPLEKPIELKATICGVADNTVVYDYQGNTYSFTVDDSFFFNKAAIDDVRKQAAVQNKTANFTIRAKTPEDLINLRDELNKNGIVPLGRFELVEDLVSLSAKTNTQTVISSLVIQILVVISVVFVFFMTSIFRKKEYSIEIISGYNQTQLLSLHLIEMVEQVLLAILGYIVLFPVLNYMTKAVFSTNIHLISGVLMISVIGLFAYMIELLPMMKVSVLKVLKTGEKA